MVEQQKELIQTTTEKLNAQSKLAEYVKKQEIYTSSYNSIVNQIKSQYAATYMEKPKGHRKLMKVLILLRMEY